MLRQVVSDGEPRRLEPTKMCRLGRIDGSSRSVPMGHARRRRHGRRRQQRAADAAVRVVGLVVAVDMSLSPPR